MTDDPALFMTDDPVLFMTDDPKTGTMTWLH